MEIFIDRTALPLFHPKYYHVLSKGRICVVDSVRKLFVLVQHKRLFFEDCFISKHVSIFGNPESRIQTFFEMARNSSASASNSRSAKHYKPVTSFALHFRYFCISARGRNTIQPISVVWRHTTPSRHSVAPSASLDSLSSNSARHYKRVAECISAAENSVTARYSVCESDLLPLFHQISHVPWSQKLDDVRLSGIRGWSSIHKWGCIYHYIPV